MQASRKFSVHPQMIYSLITAQAGTLGKAVLENVMNSIDAGASKVTIDVTQTAITIVDDGHGFRSVQEIEDCFEVFGFPHEAGARLYGQFGIGRAQLWSFCSAIWRTNTFKMDVDIKVRGLDYKLQENQPLVGGLTIESKFYSPLSTYDLQAFKQELTELALYAQIPVILNGDVINCSPSTVKWSHETEDAWIKLTPSSSLTVYNLGVLVRKYAAYQVGSGGVVVTKPGVRLALNMARNDILVSECPVWKRIKPFVQKKADETVKRKTTRLSDDERQNRIERLLSGALSLKDVSEVGLIVDILGRAHTVRGFIVALCQSGILATASEGSSLGERAHSTKLAFILHPKTLTMFGVDSVEKFRANLVAIMATQPSVHWTLDARLATAAVHETVALAVPLLTSGHGVVLTKEQTPQEVAALYALQYVNKRIRELIRDVTGEPLLAGRTLGIGVSDTAVAWTDAKENIMFNRTMLHELDAGMSGALRSVGVLVHEYLHDENSAGSHLHDETFYQRFHNVMLSSGIGGLSFEVYRVYVGRLVKLKQTLKPKLLKELSFAETLGSSAAAIEVAGDPAMA